MPFPMQPAQFPAGGYVEGGERPPGSDQTYPGGTPVTYDVGNEELDEHALGGTVTNILGVSLEGATAGVSDNPDGTVKYAKANRTNVFVAKAVNGSGVIQEVTAALIGVNRPLRKQGTGRAAWFGVNTASTTNPVVRVIGVDVERHIVFFKFLESAIQEN